MKGNEHMERYVARRIGLAGPFYTIDDVTAPKLDLREADATGAINATPSRAINAAVAPELIAALTIPWCTATNYDVRREADGRYTITERPEQHEDSERSGAAQGPDA